MVVVNWTENAKNDLISIGKFIAKDSVKYAQITIKEIRRATSNLKFFPKIGRVVPELGDDRIREIIFKNYRIIYWIKEDEIIDILTVHHSSKVLSI
jgi:addiction module RelE/StbE family toxin